MEVYINKEYYPLIEEGVNYWGAVGIYPNLIWTDINVELEYLKKLKIPFATSKGILDYIFLDTDKEIQQEKWNSKTWKTLNDLPLRGFTTEESVIIMKYKMGK